MLPSANYTFKYVNGSLTVTPATLTVTANNATRQYGLANPALTGTITGFRNGNTASVVSGLTYKTTATQSSNVGSYTITGSGATATNYVFKYVNGALTITPATLTVTADNKTRQYGVANPALTGDITGFRNGDKSSVVSGLVYKTTATQASNVGTYAITGSGGTATNYVFAYVNGTLTVTPAVLTVTANDTFRLFGQANPAFTSTITGFRNGDTASVVKSLVYSTTAAKTSKPGIYTVIPSGAVATNYVFAYVDGFLAIFPAPVS